MANTENTAIITSAALVTVPPVEPSASRRGLCRASRRPARLARPLEHQHGVVHRQAEQHHEREQRQPVDDRAVGAEAEQRLRPVVLEHRDQHAERGADRQQVERDHRHGQQR